jgi:uncharacterized protein (DUF2062 family)
LLPIPFQTLIGVALAVLIGVNIAATLAMVSPTNPITMGSVFYATYQAGRWLLDIQETVPWPALEGGAGRLGGYGCGNRFCSAVW